MIEKLIEAAIIIALMVVSYILAIVIHEFGHMCMGALCGYSFVTFVWIKKRTVWHTIESKPVKNRCSADL